MRDGNLTTRISGLAPFRNGRRVVPVKVSLLSQHANQRRGDALAHRPADLRRVFGKARGVAFAQDLSFIDHDDRAGVLLALRHRPVQRPVERRLIYLAGNGADGVSIAQRPILRRAVWKRRRDVHRGEVDVVLAGRQDGTPLVVVVLGFAWRDPPPGHGDDVCASVDGIRKVLLPQERPKTCQVLSEYFGRRALIVASYHKNAGADVMGAECRGVLALFGGWSLGQRRPREARSENGGPGQSPPKDPISSAHG